MANNELARATAAVERARAAWLERGLSNAELVRRWNALMQAIAAKEQAEAAMLSPTQATPKGSPTNGKAQ